MLVFRLGPPVLVIIILCSISSVVVFFQSFRTVTLLQAISYTPNELETTRNEGRYTPLNENNVIEHISDWNWLCPFPKFTFKTCFAHCKCSQWMRSGFYVIHWSAKASWTWRSLYHIVLWRIESENITRGWIWLDQFHWYC